MKHHAAAVAALFVLAGCGGGSGEAGEQGGAANEALANGSMANGSTANPHNSAAPASGGQTIEQPLQAADGSARGTASITETPQGLTVRIMATGLPQGPHGAHIHAVGRCDPPAFASAGSHWNPTDNQHGTENPQGPHMGDLPNLTVGADGTGTIEFTVPGAKLRGAEPALLDSDGASVVIHAKADDYRTDPAGDSGDRIACAVMGPPAS